MLTLIPFLLDALDLSNNEFKGHIPHALFELTTLGEFRIGNNFLTGSIPPGKFTDCAFLILRRFQFPYLLASPAMLRNRIYI